MCANSNGLTDSIQSFSLCTDSSRPVPTTVNHAKDNLINDSYERYTIINVQSSSSIHFLPSTVLSDSPNWVYFS